jgi:poly [ADP-ribose] polymerase 2/3/4
MAKIKVEYSPLLSEGTFDVVEVKELNSFDIDGSKNKTKGTSNKFYHAELQVEKNGTRCQIFTMYGPTGKVQKREYRYFDDQSSAKKEFDRIVKSKVKKGYTEIDVAQRAVGSESAKKITKPVVLKNADELKKDIKSSLTDGQKSIVSIFFVAQDEFVAQTLKCPLGQLTNAQIDRGREALDRAKVVVNRVTLSDKDKDEIRELTNQFYGLIPHNLGAGARGQMTELMLDSIDKIVKKEGDLDTLLDAKQVNAVLKADSSVDDKFKSLNCDFEEVDLSSDLGVFLTSYFMDTKVSQHGYGSSYVARIWKMRRKDSKEAAFVKNAERIASSGKIHNTFKKEAATFVRDKSGLWVPSKRPDLTKDEVKLYNASNTWLSWHGTRSANLVGITRRGLLVRPTGAVHTGSMFGDARYYSWQSTKSLNYCDGGYWTGRAKQTKKYMFLLDVAFGKMFLAPGPKFFEKPPNGYHSVYGKANVSGVRNDEMMTYEKTDSENQAAFKYLFEIV